MTTGRARNGGPLDQRNSGLLHHADFEALHLCRVDGEPLVQGAPSVTSVQGAVPCADDRAPATAGIRYCILHVMGSLIPRVIVIGLAAAVSPVAIMVLISLMFTKSALRNSLSFLVGYTVTLLAIGMVSVYVLHVGGSGKKGHLDAYIDIALGVLCLLGIALVFRKGKKEKETKTEAAKPFGVLRSASVGAATMLVNASTIIVYVTGVHVISSAHLKLYDSFLAVALLTLVSLVTLLIPIIIYVAFPKKADRVLGALRAWLQKHNRLIGATILLVFAAVLLARGISSLV